MGTVPARGNIVDKTASAKFHKAVKQKIMIDKYICLASIEWDTSHNNVNLKGHLALDRSSWSIKSVCNRLL